MNRKTSATLANDCLFRHQDHSVSLRDVVPASELPDRAIHPAVHSLAIAHEGNVGASQVGHVAFLMQVAQERFRPTMVGSGHRVLVRPRREIQFVPVRPIAEVARQSLTGDNNDRQCSKASREVKRPESQPRRHPSIPIATSTRCRRSLRRTIINRSRVLVHWVLEGGRQPDASGAPWRRS